MGWATVLPTALWPKLPTQDYAAWVPPLKWLSDSQKDEPLHEVYVAQVQCMIETGAHANTVEDVEWYSTYLRGLGLA